MNKQDAIEMLKSMLPEKISYAELVGAAGCYGNGGYVYADPEPYAIEMAISALEKQIPKKPICIEDKMWTCPSCDNNLMWKWEEYPNELTPRGYGNKLCLCCGQAIDWRNKDD